MGTFGSKEPNQYIPHEQVRIVVSEPYRLSGMLILHLNFSKLKKQIFYEESLNQTSFTGFAGSSFVLVQTDS
jgi:hypothetical protein